MDTHNRYQSGGRGGGGYEYRCRSNEYISDTDLYGGDGGRHKTSSSNVIIRPQNVGYSDDQFSFQRHHRFYSSVPRNYDRRKQEYRREICYGDGNLSSYDEVKENNFKSSLPPSFTTQQPDYKQKNDKRLQMYERTTNENDEDVVTTTTTTTGNNRLDNNNDGIKKQSKNVIITNTTYGAYQGCYDDGGFQNCRTTTTTTTTDNVPNVVVNINATGNGVNTVLR
ncbi:hypothetical protein Phum_PHUM498850 [Pediculus humanus corporis]|uniref:Uncharacterized protein n=1 Tax=Pediculus humanus subsp. corporis TaxID=121224 RepID=E0VXE2_PEDHC|nr:uncharacterized protein Phum_PHUM498850 [Pediculus humanus corporis]EEB18048.1 hypothetical protein Phum_PHUM498850 [Pediculus humanus corporis]